MKVALTPLLPSIALQIAALLTTTHDTFTTYSLTRAIALSLEGFTVIPLQTKTFGLQERYFPSRNLLRLCVATNQVSRTRYLLGKRGPLPWLCYLKDATVYSRG